MPTPHRNAARWLFLPFLATLACGAGDDSAVTDADAPCVDETRALTLTDGLVVEGEGVSLRLDAFAPNPPSSSDTNVWTVTLEPTQTALPSVALDMPDHGHGAPDAAVSDGANGALSFEFDLTMPGYWTVSVQTEDGLVVVPVCVDG
jgi:hypothetical protein